MAPIKPKSDALVQGIIRDTLAFANNAEMFKRIRETVRADEAANDMSDPVEVDPYLMKVPLEDLVELQRLFLNSFGNRSKMSFEAGRVDHESFVGVYTDGSGVPHIDLGEHDKVELITALLRFAARLADASDEPDGHR